MFLDMLLKELDCFELFLAFLEFACVGFVFKFADLDTQALVRKILAHRYGLAINVEILLKFLSSTGDILLIKLFIFQFIINNHILINPVLPERKPQLILKRGLEDSFVFATYLTLSCDLDLYLCLLCFINYFRSADFDDFDDLDSLEDLRSLLYFFFFL